MYKLPLHVIDLTLVRPSLEKLHGGGEQMGYFSILPKALSPSELIGGYDVLCCSR